jgi:DNA-directed RNA polymerase subunit beta
MPLSTKIRRMGRTKRLIEVYRRLRPGDLATVDNARSLLENMFYTFKRFDFSRVGRYKLNARLDLDMCPTRLKTVIMRLEDLKAIIAEIIRLNITQEPSR